MNVITRIPPSPTGHLHIGTVRTALFNYLFAKHHGGTFIFRSEDTDSARSTKEYEKEIIDGLAWLGLVHDGAIVRQSERGSRYRELLETLITNGSAYISKEPSKADANVTVEVVRLRNPGKNITFRDEIRGDITFNTQELGDFVIARSVTDALYHFAVVADDMDSGVTHVIRGEDHISNTPRQILIQEALGASRPHYAHLPLILATDRSKMSKRHGAVSLMEYKEQGFLPEAILNYLALLGWSPKDDREDFSLAELVSLFELEHVHKSGAVFDMQKFASVNQRWMRKLSDTDYITQGSFTQNLGAHPQSALIVNLLKERAETFYEAREMLSGELACLFEDPILDPVLLCSKEPKDRTGFTITALKWLLEAIQSLPSPSTPESAKDALMGYAEQEGRGAVLWPLRYALSGKERSPDPFTLIAILGIPESTSRIQRALAILEK